MRRDEGKCYLHYKKNQINHDCTNEKRSVHSEMNYTFLISSTMRVSLHFYGYYSLVLSTLNSHLFHNKKGQ